MSSFWGLGVSNCASLLVFVDLQVISIVHNNYRYMYSKGSETCWFGSPLILPGRVLKNKALLWLTWTYRGTLAFSHYDKVKPKLPDSPLLRGNIIFSKGTTINAKLAILGLPLKRHTLTLRSDSTLLEIGSMVPPNYLMLWISRGWVPTNGIAMSCCKGRWELEHAENNHLLFPGSDAIGSLCFFLRKD